MQADCSWERALRKRWWLFSAIASVFAITAVSATIYAVADQYSPVLFWDQWGSYDFHALLDNLFAQHNEHRILIPRIFFIIDLYYFNGDNKFLLASILFCQLIHAGLLWWIVGFAPEVSSEQRAALILLIIVLLFSLLQSENFFWGFQIQFVGVFTAATAAFGSLAKSAEAYGRVAAGGSRTRPVWFAVALLCSLISLLMMSNGLLTGLLMIILAFWLRLPRWQITLTAAVFATSAGIYLHGFQSPQGHARPLESLAQLDSVMLYAATYLGSPYGVLFGGMAQYFLGFPTGIRLVIAQVAGVSGILASVVLGLLVLVRGRAMGSRAEAVLLAVMAMVVGTALVTGLGRLNFTYEQALSSRYMTPALVFWAAAGLLASITAIRLSRGTGRFLLIMGSVMLVGLSGVSLIHQIQMVRHPEASRSVRDEAGLAMVVGVMDRDALKQIFVDPALPWNARDLLRQRRLSMFSEPFAAWFGETLGERFSLTHDDRCWGFFDGVTSVRSDGNEPGRVPGRVRGWAWDTLTGSVPRAIVIADDGGRIVGLGLTGYQRSDVPTAVPAVGSSTSGWQGYIQGVAGSSLTAYSVLDDGKTICRLEQRWAAPPPIVNIDEVRGSVALMADDIRIVGMWQPDGDDRRYVERPDLDGSIYGSWSGDDAHVGRLTLAGIAVPPNRRVVIPFVTGPFSSDLSMTIVGDDGREMMRLTPASPMRWSAFVLELPPGKGSKIDIVVEDKGRAWGQWIAIATPRTVADR